MGDGVVIVCSNCDDHQEYLLGGSRKWLNIEDIIDRFSPAVQGKIKNLQCDYSIEYIYYGYAIFECFQCDTAHSRLHVEIEYGGNKFYEAPYRCSECRRKLTKTYKQVENFLCRKCRSRSLKELVEFRWW